MRHLIPLTAIFLSAFLLIDGCRRKEPDAAIVRKAVATKLKKKPKDVTEADYATVTTLALSRSQISDLTPLKDLTALQELFLNLTKVSDLTPIKGLTALQGLNLGGTPVCDLSPIKELTGLQRLGISDTKVSDLTPIKELTGLRWLVLINTKVSDEQVAELKKALPRLAIIR